MRIVVGVVGHHPVQVGFGGLLPVLVVGIGVLFVVAGAGGVVIAGIAHPQHVASVAHVGVAIQPHPKGGGVPVKIRYALLLEVAGGVVVGCRGHRAVIRILLREHIPKRAVGH